ncbi:MAG: DJ-1/PfpI family protein [Solirubrobacteraceae bacterium]|nr:DJ-1/PfpI family protein [Solirubrobacteraceae bacterium]
MRMCFVLYPGFTALDLVGPYEVLSRWPDAEVHFLSSGMEPVRADVGLTVVPTDTPATLPDPDMIIVPGASDPLEVLKDAELIGWLAKAGRQTTWNVSVCTGAVLYAEAGLLQGRRATTHWSFREGLKAMGVEVSANRVVFDEPFMSGAGVSAGIDLALALTKKVHGEELAKALQLAIEYDPDPEFDVGSPEKADAGTLRLALKLLLGDRPADLAARATGHMTRHRVRRAREAMRARRA